LWRLEDQSEVDALTVACRAEAARCGRQGDVSHVLFWHAVADRISPLADDVDALGWATAKDRDGSTPPLVETAPMNHYEARLEAKRQRLARGAEKAQASAARHWEAGTGLADQIPLGQPILIGHHSEKRHRGDLKRIHGHFDKAVTEGERARELAARADAVGTGGISSDDPAALVKLRANLAADEMRRDDMKALNAHFKKTGTLDGAPGDAALVAEGRINLSVWQGVYNRPFPAYCLSNLGATIRTTKNRIEQEGARAMDRADSPEPRLVSRLDVEGLGAVEVMDDPLENRVMITFPARLGKAGYQAVRAGGFVWSPTRGAFVRKRSNRAVDAASAAVCQVARAEGWPTVGAPA